jgi:hypothetical protein
MDATNDTIVSLNILFITPKIQEQNMTHLGSGQARRSLIK